MRKSQSRLDERNRGLSSRTPPSYLHVLPLSSLWLQAQILPGRAFSCYLTPPLTPSSPSQRSEPTFITLKVQSVHTNNRSSRASEVKRPPQVLKVVAQSYRARIARTERHGTQRKQLIQRRCDKLQYHSASTPPRTGDFPAARDGTNQHLNTSKAAASQTYCSGLGR
jgi:hypothetical protein